jgi:DNA-binding winged helix-turn-helix (wHTH) protein
LKVSLKSAEVSLKASGLGETHEALIAVAGMSVRLIEFGSFTLDLDRLCLWDPSGQVDLRPKSFEVVRYLAQHAGRVVTKDELIKAVWGDLNVSDESLAVCISEVRRTLGDKHQQIIKTLPKRGYLMDVAVPTTVTPVAPPNWERTMRPSSVTPEIHSPLSPANSMMALPSSPEDW